MNKQPWIVLNLSIVTEDSLWLASTTITTVVQSDSKWSNVKFCQNDSEKLQWQSHNPSNTVTLPSSNKANVPALVVFLDSSNNSEESSFHSQSTFNLKIAACPWHMSMTILCLIKRPVCLNDQNQMRREEQSTYIAILSQDALLPLTTIGAFCYILPWNISKTVTANLKIMTDPHAPVGICVFTESVTK